MKSFRALCATALCLTGAFLAPATLQAQTDVIRGKVTLPDGQPAVNVRVTATSIPGNISKETRTDKKGAYQLAFANGEGDYIMGFAALGHAYKQFEIKRTADQDILIADAKLQPVVLEAVTAFAQAAQQRVDRFSGTPDVGGTERPVSNAVLPIELQGDIAAMAASLPGVQLIPGVDGGADGFSVFGLGADQNNVTLNGLQFDGSSLPRDAQMSSSLVTSSYDVGRGGFSGGQFSVRTGSGSNYQTRGFNIVFNSPQLQWTDRAGQAVGSKFTNLSAGGVFSGPIKLNESFYNVSYQIGRRSNDLQTLLNTGPLGLQTAGVAVDSVSRLVDILGQAGISALAGGVGQSRLSDNGSLLGTFNFTSPTSATAQTFTITTNGNWSRQSPVGGGLTELPSRGADRTSYGGGIQGNHSGYFGLTLSETNVGVNVSSNYGDPYLDLPSGRVRVSSFLENGASGVSSLAFGGNPSQSTQSTTANANLMNTLSWFSDNNKHRVKLTTEARYEHAESDQSTNLLGSFTFNSLADLEAGIPASFTRQLTARRRSTGGVTGAMSLGDSYRRTPDLQIQYGIRVDANRFLSRPGYNPEVERVFGVRNDRTPQRFYVTPRIGFSWTVGTAPVLAGFDGAVRGPRAVVRGGIGIFQNASNAGLITSALDNTGLPSGIQQLVCTGAAAPIPDWDAYAANPSLVPTQCADGTGGTVFANSSPNVTVFDKHFAAQKRVSSNLSWDGRILRNRFSARIEGTYSLNMNQQRTVDLNFKPETRFSLAGEANRPVYVLPTSIVTTTGSIASRDARVSQAFNRVTEMRSDIRSETRQVSINVSPVLSGPAKFTWNGAYTFTSVREQVPGFSSTVGNPFDVDWARGGNTGAHQFNYRFGYNFWGYVGVNWSGALMSGAPFTPTIAGDVNGDGYSNDRAFIFAPSAGGDAVASAMMQLIDNSSGRTRECLEKQLGQLAGRNSCSGPWRSSASLSISLDPVKFRMPHRARVSMSLSNPLGAADLAVNGSGNLKGWGQSPFPDQALLYVRGFDPQARRYIYEVNQRFGATRPAFVTLRSPVNLTIQARYDLGPTRERQLLEQRLNPGRRLPGTRYPETLIKSSLGTTTIPNPFLTIIAQQDSLRLTVEQSDSLAAMSRRYTYRVDSIWTPVARALAALPETYDADEAYVTWLRARRAAIALLEVVGPATKQLLTAEQRRKLPASVLNYFDPLFLASLRNGTPMYFGPSGMMSFTAPAGMAPVHTVIHR